MGGLLSFLLENKILAVKLFLIGTIAAGGTVAVITHYPTQQHQKDEEVLGQNVSTLFSSPTPTPPPEKPVEKAQNFIDTSINKAKDIVHEVIKTVTTVAQDTASKSADTLSKSIIQSSVSTVMDQIEKLPKKDQEEIKKNICK